MSNTYRIYKFITYRIRVKYISNTFQIYISNVLRTHSEYASNIYYDLCAPDIAFFQMYIVFNYTEDSIIVAIHHRLYLHYLYALLSNFICKQRKSSK